MGQQGKNRKRANPEGQPDKAEKVAKVKVKLAPRDKAVELLKGMSSRLERFEKKLGKLPLEEFDGTLASMRATFDGWAGEAAALPADWKPSRAKRGSSLVVTVGDKVTVKATHAAKYADMFAADTVLEVTDVRVALVAVKGPEMEAPIFLPKGHLQAV